MHFLIAHAAGHPESDAPRPDESLRRHECPRCGDSTYRYQVTFPDGTLTVWACWNYVCGVKCGYYHVL
jgi:ribosomal protein S27AE